MITLSQDDYVVLKQQSNYHDSSSLHKTEVFETQNKTRMKIKTRKLNKFTNMRMNFCNNRKKWHMIECEIQTDSDMQHDIHSEFSEYFQ